MIVAREDTIRYFANNRNIESDKSRMQLSEAVNALSALAHIHRLAVFRLLVRAGSDGVSAGGIAREVGVLPNTLSTHLGILVHAGLVLSRREGRSVIYSANYERMQEVLGFLVSECCGGRSEICAPLDDILETMRHCVSQ